VWRGCLCGLLLVLAVEVAWGTLGGNVRTVVPGRIYRSGQLSGARLEALIRRRGVRTVINLRGCCAGMAWYCDECRVTHRLNVSQEDICLSAARLPSVHEVRRLVEVLDQCEYPVLFHCFRGADRTGLASTVARLLYTDDSPDDALGQMGLRYGHVPLGKLAHLDRFFDLYAEWLGQQGREHTPAAFRHWVGKEYCPGECRCRLELLRAPEFVVCGVPFALPLRVYNTSIKPWRLRAGNNAGIHAAFTVYDYRGEKAAEGRAGLFDAQVEPGERIDLTLAVRGLAVPGRYRLVVDLVDEQHCNFYQAGSELLEWEFDVREPEAPSGR
jgi:protein tyrosine phosphatase (PTP) superfamily phosphohydrolase (DUF442 family)